MEFTKETIEQYINGTLSRSELKSFEDFLLGHEKSINQVAEQMAMDQLLTSALCQNAVNDQQIISSVKAVIEATSTNNLRTQIVNSIRLGAEGNSQAPYSDSRYPENRSKVKPAILLSLTAMAACLAVALVLFWNGDSTTVQKTIGILTSTKGNQILIHRNGKIITSNKLSKIQQNDIIEVKETGKVLTFRYAKENSSIIARPGSKWKVWEDKKVKRVQLLHGNIHLSIAKQAANQQMIIETPHAKVTVLGTTFELTVDKGSTLLKVIEGKVKFQQTHGKGKVFDVTSGNYAINIKGKATCGIGPYPKNSTNKATGFVTREVWTNIEGDRIVDFTSHKNYPSNPQIVEKINKIKTPTDWGDAYGQRIRGYIHPKETGIYTIYCASDDQSKVWISTDHLPENKKLITHIKFFTKPLAWERTGKKTLKLEAGKRYYIEVLHKETSGMDHLAVAWQLEEEEIQIIGSDHISQYIEERK